jgi:uncharacterized protein (TIGR02145 family)
MRIFLIVCMVLGMVLVSCSLKPTLRGSFVDKRDDYEYKWIKLKDQIWMAQNLDFISPNSLRYVSDSAVGRFYRCEVAKDVCPVGWHLPTDDEWKVLEVAAGMGKEEVNFGKWRGTVAPRFLMGGSTGFNVLFLGIRKQLYFDKFGEEAHFWTSTLEGKLTYTRTFVRNQGQIGRNLLADVNSCNIRCLKNDTITAGLTVMKKGK